MEVNFLQSPFHYRRSSQWCSIQKGPFLIWVGIIWCSVQISSISFALYLYFCLGLWKKLYYILHLTLYLCRLLSKKKLTRFSEVLSSGPIRLTGKSAFMLVPFYPNQCILLVGPPLGGILEKMLVFHTSLSLYSIESGWIRR